MRCSKPTITKIEKAFIEDALIKNDIGVGEYLEKFETAWREYNEKKYAVACNSCTNALYLAIKALGIGPGDEVIVPEFTMAATAWAVSYTGATPIFVDCKDDLTLDETKLIATKKTKAIMPVHIYGRRCNMDAINKFAKKHKLWVVEDMAEAHGILPTGDISCYSFYGNKILTTGEGGMCLTDNASLAREMRLLANMYFDKGRTLLHPKIGHNFRLTNLQAAIGFGQVQRIKEILKKRHQIAAWYDRYLDKKFVMPKREVVWMYDIDCGNLQKKIKSFLEKNNVEARFFFKPMSMQPMYKSEYKNLNAYRWSKRGLYLPTYFDMTEADVQRVAKLVNHCLPTKAK